MPILTADHLVALNLSIAKENGGIWYANKGEANLKTVVELINDGRQAWNVRAAMAGLSVAALQPFRDGNHRTGIMILYHLMICGRMMPRQSALHIYGKLSGLVDAFEKAIGEYDKLVLVATRLANFMGSKVKKWGPKELLLSHIGTIIPSVAREVDRIPAQMAIIGNLEKQYRQQGARLIPKEDADLSNAGQVRMYVAYAKALNYTF